MLFSEVGREVIEVSGSAQKSIYLVALRTHCSSSLENTFILNALEVTASSEGGHGSGSAGKGIMRLG